MTVKDLKELLQDLDDDMEIMLTDKAVIDKYFSCRGCDHEEQAVNEDPCPRCRRLKLDYYKKEGE